MRRALLLLLASCGGNSENTAPLPDASVADAPGEAAAVDGGAAPTGSDPGKLKCASETCTTATQLCCLEADSTSRDKSCMPLDAGSACPAPRRECDEAADCPSGQKCCEGMHAAAFHIRSTMCAAKCEPQIGSPGICKTDAECAPDSCVVVQCRGETVGFCGGPPYPDFCKPQR